MAFFEASEVTSRPPIVSSIPKCGACGLFKTCASPKMPVTGRGKKGILVVAEAPGAEEDSQGVQLVGEAGQVLRDALAKLDVDLDRDCWKTNSLICRPPGNRTPTNDEIDYCRPNLRNTIQELQPSHIMPLGAVAVRSLLGPLWRDDVGAMGVWAGWKIPLQAYNSWVTPNYHPSYVLRSRDDKGGGGNVIKVWFERYLKESLTVSGRPWDPVPNYEKEVRVEYDPDRAAAWLLEKTAAGGPVAFDYETNMLKPDSDLARIVSCAVCWRGVETVAFPWVGAVIPAMGAFLRSDLPKIGANCKFEDRWTRKEFGHGVKNFVWDTVLDAHILDNRKGITSVKFQSFVRLGIPDWSYSIKEFLKSPGDNIPNRIHLVDLRTLLQYNGIDALAEYKIGVLQKKEFRDAEI